MRNAPRLVSPHAQAARLLSLTCPHCSYPTVPGQFVCGIVTISPTQQDAAEEDASSADAEDLLAAETEFAYSFGVGDRVACLLPTASSSSCCRLRHHGALADLTTCPARAALRVPPGVRLDDAAAALPGGWPALWVRSQQQRCREKLAHVSVVVVTAKPISPTLANDSHHATSSLRRCYGPSAWLPPSSRQETKESQPPAAAAAEEAERRRLSLAGDL